MRHFASIALGGALGYCPFFVAVLLGGPGNAGIALTALGVFAWTIGTFAGAWFALRGQPRPGILPMVGYGVAAAVAVNLAISIVVIALGAPATTLVAIWVMAAEMALIAVVTASAARLGRS